jgi:hypothetical protein
VVSFSNEKYESGEYENGIFILKSEIEILEKLLLIEYKKHLKAK